MGHPQNTPRGLFLKKGPVTIGANTLTSAASGVQFSAGIALSAQSGYITQTASGVIMPTGLALSGKSTYITQNSTAVILPAGLRLSGKTPAFTANSTATLIIPTVSALPSARIAGGLVFVRNSTGVGRLAFHNTGTTWKYADTTSVLA